MLRRVSIAAPIALLLSFVACSDGPTPPLGDPVVVAMQELSTAYGSQTDRGDWAWYAIAALQHGAELTPFTADVDGQARAFKGVALGIVYDDQDGVDGPIYRDSLVVLVGWRGSGAREMIATAHISDNFPFEEPTMNLVPELDRPRVRRALPVFRASQRNESRLPARSVGVLAAGDLALHYLWYMVDGSVWIDSLVRSAEANLDFASQQCSPRSLTLPAGYFFDTQDFPCFRGTFRQSMDVRLWPEVDENQQPLATGRFNLVMRPAEYALPNFLDLLQ